jgi:cell division transport system permease protein
MAMKISSFKYYFVDAFKSLKRNMTISTASMATVAASLFIMGVFLLTMLNVSSVISSVESKVEIKVFLKDDITLTDQRDIEIKLKGGEGVKEVVFESKSEALRKFTEQLSEKDRSLLSGYDNVNNPLPSSFIVRMDNPEMAQSIADAVEAMRGVESVGNDKELIENIISISKAIRWIGLAIFVMLIGVSLFLIVNTIKLTVFSRRREIGIMKFVGATDWFIRWPFVIEGVVLGVIGGLIANIILYYSYKFTVMKITEALMAIQLLSPGYVLTTILWQFLAAGAAIGAVGSVIALRKFLTV